MAKFTIPIYWTQTFKTKPDKTVLNGLNFYRNSHFHTLNRMKLEVQEVIIKQLQEVGPVLGPYKVHYDLYYKTPTCDGSNIIAIMEKLFLDSLQIAGTVREDNVKHHKGSSWQVVEQDKLNPRVEVYIIDATSS